jgi:hypothetical protein
MQSKQGTTKNYKEFKTQDISASDMYNPDMNIFNLQPPVLSTQTPFVPKAPLPLPDTATPTTPRFPPPLLLNGSCPSLLSHSIVEIEIHA